MIERIKNELAVAMPFVITFIVIYGLWWAIGQFAQSIHH